MVSKSLPTRFNIVFMGTPEFAVPALNVLLQGPDKIRAVVTQPDRPRGRGRKVLPPPVKVLAQEAGLKVFQPVKVSEPEFIDEIKGLSPDLLVVCAFGQILPRELLDVPSIMPINIHGSLLPKYRGAAPIQWAILNGEDETGITIMEMDAGMDTGPMLLKRSLAIGLDTTYGELSRQMAELGASSLMEALDLLEHGKLAPTPQPEEGVTYAPPIKKEQLRIDWSRPAREIHCKIRAFDPLPGAYTNVEDQRVRFYRPEFVDCPGGSAGQPPGTVLEVGSDGIVVACGEGCLRLREIQWPGRKRLKVADFLRGRRIPTGIRLG